MRNGSGSATLTLTHCASRIPAPDAPMILTVTPNTGLDRVLFLPALEPGRRQEAARVVEAMGGKGCDVSLILRALGEETVATGLAAGATGQRLDAWLREAGVETDFVWTEGETRLNTVLIETATGRHTTICAEGLLPLLDDLLSLGERITQRAPRAEAIAICGSLPRVWPPLHYRSLVSAARQSGRPVVVDAAGDALRAALWEGVDAVKPNRQELEGIAGGPLATLAEVAAAARNLIEMGTSLVIASLGPEGALAVTADETWFAPPAPVEVVNPAGAGDGMTAMVALGLGRGWEVPEILRQAVAVATAITTTEATAECPPMLVNQLLRQVKVTNPD